MENSYFFLFLTGILVLGSLMGILPLVFSSNKVQVELENSEEEEHLRYQIRIRAAANKAALGHSIVNEENINPKTVHIDHMAVDKKHHISIADLRERNRVQKQKQKVTIQ
ncbi:hypothetical protein FEE95_06465 [Maribacter algarum]|uniref:Uncharacterized protein n=1 Tax=Maribacter algarum (ex Zhang et al. 2020) TaxID=2578118 RepID=A0A5S3PXU5_9FLAO|nr:hypothetical protein [Maribacter algarum]TMM59072.1 hypothetical protein FEE95_06465 [Maribacter algarum]